MNRRKFLSQTGLITAGTLLIPSFIRASVGLELSKISKKRLVVIQLSGGNDGLNTIIPYGIDEYYLNRKNIGILKNETLKIDDQFGFHPSLTKTSALHKNGMLSIINSVGYPNPNRSHFRSMDIWHSGSNSNEYISSGWLGRYLDNHCSSAHQGIELNGSLSLALKGENNSGIAFTNPNTLYKTIKGDFYDGLASPQSKNKELNYLYKVFDDTVNSAKYIYDQHHLKTNNFDYGKGQFSNHLKEIATLLKSGIETPVFYTSLGGFDTHVNQINSQQRLLAELDSGLGNFVANLEKENLMDDTCILVFSEFGRRLNENASRGTDHGAANALFVIDKDLSNKAHQYNQIDLINLEDGDPKYKYDFRSVYQEILNKVLKVPSKDILGKEFSSLELFK
jgi:uncharacterized protein (DUF1501 family)